MYGYHEPRRFGECLGLAVLSVGVFALFLLGLAVEGLFCIIMAFPLGLILALVGGVIGYAVQVRRVQPTLTMLSIALYPFGVILRIGQQASAADPACR
jgi:hypothetical protein